MFGSNSIRKSVMEAVDTMIANVQRHYDEQVEQIDRDAEHAKMLAREDAVESIVSKFR